MTIVQQSPTDTNHRARSAILMSDNSVIDHLPRHFRRWIAVAQRMPLVAMIFFTLSIVFDNDSPVGTMQFLNRWGISQTAFSVICIMATAYLIAATRKLDMHSVVHFLIGTMPFLMYISATIARVFIDTIPFTAVVIYLFAYAALTLFYWLAIALVEWELSLHLKERVTS